MIKKNFFIMQFYNGFFHRTQHFFQLLHDLPYHTEEAAYCFVDDSIAEPDKKTPQCRDIDKHTDCRANHCRKTYHTIISIVQKCKADAKADCPVKDILKVNSKPAMSYQTSEQPENIV